MSRLYTFIVEHDGASSVSQVNAVDVEGAFRCWRGDLERHLGDILSEGDLRQLESSLETDYPTAVHQRRNVWFACGHTTNALARISIVQTDER